MDQWVAHKIHYIVFIGSHFDIDEKNPDCFIKILSWKGIMSFRNVLGKSENFISEIVSSLIYSYIMSGFN